MTLEPGTRLGSYQVVCALGAGGMGEVYRAHDVALGRDVAIKILPTHFANDAERLSRFEREARTLAALNHPNIAAIYGLERNGTTSVLVMELAEGETLARRIARGRMPIDEAISIAVQIAQALEAAHEKGIVHRDLKPGNVVVASTGRVKVLDFGLAKLTSVSEPDSGPFSPANSPTIAASMAGTILGTAAYMSPEQARGKAVDKRADIWAFGCVVFEMLAGKPAFGGETITDIVATVVKNDPDWNLLPADTPASLKLMLRRCLSKDPAHRLRDIGDALLQLQEPQGIEWVSAAPKESALGARIPAAAAAVAIVLALATGFLVGHRSTSAPAPSGVSRLELSPPFGVELYNGDAQDITLSPNGSRIAFVGVRGGVRQVYVRRLDEFETTALRGTEGAFSCFFSPTGDALGFISTNRSLKTISLSDGLVETVLPSDADYTTGNAWGPDGMITYGWGGTLWQIPASGGTPKRLTTLDAGKGELAHAFPTSVGNSAILFTTILTDRRTRIESLTPPRNARTVVAESGAFPMVAANRHLVFFRDESLLGAPFDPARLTIDGPVARLMEIAGIGTAGMPPVALSQSGTFVYATNATTANRLVWVSRQGAAESVGTPRKLYFSPRMSPDGRRIVVQTSGYLWIQDTSRTTFTRLASQTFADSFPVWTPDSKRIIFRTSSGLHWADPDSGESQKIPETTIGDFPSSISPDGEIILIARQTANTQQDVYAVSLHERWGPKPLINTAAYEGGAQWSPDGRWIAYVSNESGQMQVYVRPYPALDRRTPVSTQGGTGPIWNRNGRELFYRDGDKMMAVDVTPDGDAIRLSAPRLLFEQPYAYGQTITLPNYDVGPDGQRLLMVKDEPGSGRLNVVLNWLDELQRLAPVR